MANATPQQRDAFGIDLYAGSEALRQSVVPKTQTDRSSTWEVWVSFTEELGVEPFLSDYGGEPIDCFIVFAMRTRRGELAKNKQHRAIGSKRVEEALRAVGARFTQLGEKDPRLTEAQKYVPRLKGVFKFFENEDPAPGRVAPCCLTILMALIQVLQDHPNRAFADAIIDLACLAYFFLCRPGEYAKSTANDQGRSSPFRLQDVLFGTPTQNNLNAAICSLHDVRRSTFVALVFTDQKNCVRGETVGHRTNDQPFWDVTKRIARRVEYLRLCNAPPDTPLHTYYDIHNQPHHITTLDITQCLRTAAQAVYTTTGILPNRICSQSLRSGGATALLCANWAKDKVQLLGRWKSDAMLRYLRMQAMQSTSDAARAMFKHGNFSFHPTTKDTDQLPQETPPEILALLQTGNPE